MVELLVAMALTLVVMSAIFGIWFGLGRTYEFTVDDTIAQEQARRAMIEMVELIRTAREPDTPPSEALSAVITQADDNQITFWVDLGKDQTLELVRFRVDGDARTLYQETADVNGVFDGNGSVRLVTGNLANDADHPLFSYRTYLAPNYPAATPVVDPLAIREVHISLRVDISPDRSPITHELNSVVQPRNLRQY